MFAEGSVGYFFISWYQSFSSPAHDEVYGSIFKVQVVAASLELTASVLAFRVNLDESYSNVFKSKAHFQIEARTKTKL